MSKARRRDWPHSWSGQARSPANWLELAKQVRESRLPSMDLHDCDRPRSAAWPTHQCQRVGPPEMPATALPPCRLARCAARKPLRQTGSPAPRRCKRRCRQGAAWPLAPTSFSIARPPHFFACNHARHERVECQAEAFAIVNSNPRWRWLAAGVSKSPCVSTVSFHPSRAC